MLMEWGKDAVAVGPGRRELQVGQRLQIQSSLTQMGDGCQESLRLGYKEPQCQNKGRRERATHTQAAPLHKPPKTVKEIMKIKRIRGTAVHWYQPISAQIVRRSKVIIYHSFVSLVQQ